MNDIVIAGLPVGRAGLVVALLSASVYHRRGLSNLVRCSYVPSIR